MQDMSMAEFFAATVLMHPYAFVIFLGLFVYAAIREELEDRHKKNIDDFLLPILPKRRLSHGKNAKTEND